MNRYLTSHILCDLKPDMTNCGIMHYTPMVMRLILYPQSLWISTTLANRSDNSDTLIQSSGVVFVVTDKALGNA